MSDPLDLDALKERFEAGYPAQWSSGASANARNADMRALIAEVERLRGLLDESGQGGALSALNAALANARAVLQGTVTLEEPHVYIFRLRDALGDLEKACTEWFVQ